MTMRLLLGPMLLTASVLRADIAEDRNKVEDRRVKISTEVRAMQTVATTVKRDKDMVDNNPVAGPPLSR